MRPSLFPSLLLGLSLTYVEAAEIRPPYAVGTPPADAGRGLVRVSPTEIRHYDGDRKQPGYLVSRDNGGTWAYVKAPASYPLNYGGLAKEAPAFARNPRTGEFVRVQPIGDHVFHSRGGLDGEWVAVTKEGRLSDGWRDQRAGLLTIPGILRTPLFVDEGRRLLLPAHGNGTTFWLSDDGGLNWRRSRTTLTSPPHVIGGVHQGLRWQNNAVEATAVELKDGRVWALLRTSQDHHYESFSADRGETWSVARPSRFAGTLTMPTVGRLPDGRLLFLWTNQAPLPELRTATGRGEDAFTNRDTLHAAVSADEGRTWRGFREVALDPQRARPDYATWGGPQDRGQHQAEFLPLDEHRVLVACGQHARHRRLLIMDTRWLAEKERRGDFTRGTEDWTCHTFVSVPRGHCSYDRRPAARVVPHPERPATPVLEVRRLDDPALVNVAAGADHRAGGAAWNFPAGESGRLTVRFRLPTGSTGAHLSLTDRLYAACDRTAPASAAYTTLLAPGARFGAATLRADADHELTLSWSGTGSGAVCRLSLDGAAGATLPLRMPAPNGLSYLHLISAGEDPAPGLLLEQVEATVR